MQVSLQSHHKWRLYDINKETIDGRFSALPKKTGNVFKKDRSRSLEIDNFSMVKINAIRVRLAAEAPVNSVFINVQANMAALPKKTGNVFKKDRSRSLEIDNFSMVKINAIRVRLAAEAPVNSVFINVQANMAAWVL